MGYVNKVFCNFATAFWPTDTQYFGAHTASKGMLNYRLSDRKFSSINCLVGLAVGNAGRTIEAMSNAETQFSGDNPAQIHVRIVHTSTHWNQSHALDG